MAFPAVAARLRPRVVLELVDYAALLTPAPVVTVLHSSVFNARAGLLDPARHAYHRALGVSSASRSRRVIAPSQVAADAVLEDYGLGTSRVEVVPHGGGLVEAHPDLEVVGGGGILRLETLYPHKNGEALVRAYARLAASKPDAPPLVYVGADPGGRVAAIRDEASRLGVEDGVQLRGRASDAAVLEALSRADVVAFPSSVEGFGVPALEAMQAGVPLVVAEGTAQHEVAGDAALAADPLDADAFGAALERALTCSSLQREMVRKGKVQGTEFSWAETTRRTLEVVNAR